MSRSPIERPAPGGLELVRALVNTRDLDRGTDALRDPAEARTWLAANGLHPPRALIGQELATLVELREALREILIANATEGSAPNGVALINRTAEESRVDMRLSPSGVLVPKVGTSEFQGVLGRVIAVVFDAITVGTWPRLKACPSPTCHWVYYDASRNRSSRWCDMGVCGSRAKRQAMRDKAKIETRR